MSTNFAPSILEKYRKGQRYFNDLDLDDEIFDGLNLEGIIFENCFLYSSFRGTNLTNAKFINGNIKTCDFREADLTNAHFENLAVESAQFSGAITNEYTLTTIGHTDKELVSKTLRNGKRTD